MAEYSTFRHPKCRIW